VTWAPRDLNGFPYTPNDLKAAPVNPDTTAIILGVRGYDSAGLAIYDGTVERPDFFPIVQVGRPEVTIYADTVAWGDTDSILATSENDNDYGLMPLYALTADLDGAHYAATNNSFNLQYDPIYSDFGTGLIYSDDGNVADPTTAAQVGTFNASGIVVPDSSLNRVFILGKTVAQTYSYNFTIQSFDEKTYKLVSSITVDNLDGSPFAMVRWGASGLAILTATGGGPDGGSYGMLYILKDAKFVSSMQRQSGRALEQEELVQRRWKPLSRADVMKMRQGAPAGKVQR
jgi:hypothetical protein